MAELPVISGSQCAQALATFGYQATRQRGSHLRLVAPGRAPITVPLHRELDRGTLRAILRTARIEPEEFVRALR